MRDICEKANHRVFANVGPLAALMCALAVPAKAALITDNSVLTPETETVPPVRATLPVHVSQSNEKSTLQNSFAFSVASKKGHELFYDHTPSENSVKRQIMSDLSTDRTKDTIDSLTAYSRPNFQIIDSFTEVPEPDTWTMMIIGLLTLFLAGWIRKLRTDPKLKSKTRVLYQP